MVFDEFWQAYPKKVAKKDALKAWKGIKVSDALKDEIINGVNGWKESKQWCKDDGQFIPYPATFLRQELWKDVPKSMNVSSFGGDTSLSDYEAILNRKIKAI